MKGSRNNEDQLSNELKKTTRRIARLEKENKALRKSEARFRGLVETGSDSVWELTIFQKFTESSEQGLGMADVEGNVTYINRALGKIFGGDPKDFLGKSIKDHYLKEDLSALEKAILPSVMKNVPQKVEMPLVSSDGKVTDAIQSIFLIHDKEGKPHLANVITDITDRKEKEKKLLEYQENLEELVKERTATLEAEIAEGKRREAIIKKQSVEILELSTPVIQVLEGVLVAPLIGTLDSERTQQFMERLLSAIVETKSRVALVDITGVPTVDTQTAQHLIEAVTAVRLLGAKVVLTGISPPIAQTLVHLGIELSEVTTRSSLAGGLQVAFSDLGLEVHKRS